MSAGISRLYGIMQILEYDERRYVRAIVLVALIVLIDVEESARIRGYVVHTWVKGRKRHILVDTVGLPIAWYVTPADVHETVGAQAARGPRVLRA